jgi:enamine deaminase RidA (YjgF/YER057c/UK114 family)
VSAVPKAADLDGRVIAIAGAAGGLGPVVCERLAAAGATLADIVKTTTYVTDIEEFFKHVDVRMEYFGALPTSTTVEVRRLAHPDLLVEVEVIAVVG